MDSTIIDAAFLLLIASVLPAGRTVVVRRRQASDKARERE